MMNHPLEREDGRELNSLSIYLREIGETPLLTAKEERALARRVRKGDKAAKEHMIRANLRLVVRLARDYANQGLPLEDLIAEGNVGLMRAVEKFDPKHNVKLSTYASLWIKQSMRRALSNQSKTIRLPVHVVDRVAHMKRVERKLADELGRVPTDEELSDSMGVPPRKLAQLKQSSLPTYSLDAVVGEDGETSMGSLIADEKAGDPFEVFREKSTREDLKGLLNDLDERERTIVVKRFGLDQSEPMTLDMVGRQLKVTRERIRQIQDEALLKLRRKLKELEKERLLPVPPAVEWN